MLLKLLFLSSSMASFMTSKLFTLAFLSSLILISTTAVVSGREFIIGGSNGWIKPTGNDSNIYNEWAVEHRFHVGDSLYFKYQNDSVLVVNYPDYASCNIANPISKFTDGHTVFTFDRHGFFYFISGEQGHCKSGQKLDIRVMVHSRFLQPPSIAPSPQGEGEGGSGSGSGDYTPPAPPSSSSTGLVASYFMSAFGGLMVLVYLFL